MDDMAEIEVGIRSLDRQIAEESALVDNLRDELDGAECSLARLNRERYRLYFQLAAAAGDNKPFVTKDGVRVGPGDSVYSEGFLKEGRKFDIHDGAIGSKSDSGGYFTSYYHGEEGMLQMADRIAEYNSHPEAALLDEFADMLAAQES